MKAINLDTYSLSLLTAKEDILNPRSSTNWALFIYVGITNNLKLCDSGVGGVNELAGKFHVKRPQYGLCRVGMDGQGLSHIVMIIWVGEGVDEYRSTECASHAPAVKAFFKEAHVFVNASRPEEVTEERIRDIISKLDASKGRVQRGRLSADKEETVGTNYKRTIAAMEILRFSRDSFWACAEKEEEDRKEEESRRAIEDRRRREKERIQQERREAEERDRKVNDKEQLIQKQRKIQAEVEAEARRREKLKWEQQQREHEEEMRACFRHSESIEKAAEAAALVSQRSINPREFFRQLSSSSSSTPSNPGCPRTVRPPFRRYQRSLTDTAFIFGRSGSTTPPSSPRSPTVVSPSSRIPTSPYHKSPPNPGCSDLTFQPIASPHQHHIILASPPTSPQCPTPASSLPNLLPSRPLPPLSPQTQPPSSPHSTSAPEPQTLASPTPIPLDPPTLPALLPSLSQSQSSSSSSPVPLEPPRPVEAPARPLPENLEVASLQCLSQSEGHEPPLQILRDPEVQAMVVEEEKGETDGTRDSEEKAKPQMQASDTATDLAGGERSPVELFKLSDLMIPVINETVEETEPALDSTSPVEEDLESEAVGEPSAEDGDENELGEAEEGTVPPAPSQQPFVTGRVNEGVEYEAVFHPYLESGATAKNICLSELDNDSGLSPSTNEHDGMEECLGTDGLLRVRVLYDYQAEHDSELSLVRGDIISVVEIVDKSWWKGWNKDGRQGLFPAKYVEAIEGGD